jgi:FdhE protein
MTSAQTVSSEYDARIRRAEGLSVSQPSAREVLTFYRRIAAFQKDLHAHIVASRDSENAGDASTTLRGEPDLTVLLPRFRGYLSLVEQNAPSALATAAHQMASLPAESWISLLTAYWEQGGRFDQQIGAFALFLPRSFLQPYAAFLAAQISVPPVQATPRVCPLCGARPLLGVLRPEGDGGKRCLVCAFCGHEWDFRRIFCPGCGEEDEKKLPVYVAEQLPHVRVEACDTCKFFVRTIDLTKDGHAVPIVDDLAAIPLTLWAHEHGYSRLLPNLLGT